MEPNREMAENGRSIGDFLQPCLEEGRIITGETRKTIEELQEVRERLFTQFANKYAAYEYVRRKAQYQRALAEEVCRTARLLHAEVQERLQHYKERQHMLINTNKTYKEKGTGQGLSTCNEIIQDHKGKIDVDSQPGQGEA